MTTARCGVIAWARLSSSSAELRARRFHGELIHEKILSEYNNKILRA